MEDLMEEEEKKEKEVEVDLSRDRSKDPSKTFEVEKKRRSSRNVSRPPKYVETMDNSDGETEPAVKKSRSESERRNEKMSLSNKSQLSMKTRYQKSAKTIRLFDINDDDFLSNLPDDCIKTIFKKFKIEELEKMCEVSRKMQHFAVLAKSRKGHTGRIKITQLNDGDFVLAAYEDEFDRGDCLYMTVKTTANGMIETVRKRCKISGRKPEEIDESLGGHIVLKRSSIPSEIFSGFEHLIRRFDIRNIWITWVLMDDNFLSNVKRILKGIDGLNLSIWNTYFEKKNLNMTRKFMNWIGSAKAKSINLHEIQNMSTLSGAIYEKLINSAAKSSPGSKLEIFTGNYNSFKFPNEVPCDSITKFSYFNLQDLKVDVESMREIVKKILTDKSVGSWLLTTSSRFEIDELLTFLGADVEVIDESPNQNDGRIISLRLNGFVIRVEIMNYNHSSISRVDISNPRND